MPRQSPELKKLHITEKVINKFYAGIQRDDKSDVVGGAFNIEELDIFSNKDSIQAEQIFSADTMPASTTIYAYCSGDDDTVYAYGQKTTATIGTVRITKVASGGGTNPGTFADPVTFTSADVTNLATKIGDIKFLRTTEATNPTSVYYIQGTGTTWYITRFNTGAAAEQTWNGTTWTGGTANASSQLTGLTGSSDRPTMKVIFGALYICNGQYIAKVAKDFTFTEKFFTLPAEWQAVDIIGVSDVFLILCRNRNLKVNFCRAFWWDGLSSNNFSDSFHLPAGVPLWIVNHQERIKIACAANGGVATTTNGTLRIFQLSGAFPGAVPVEIPGVVLGNIQADASTQPISSPKMVFEKDKILYFGLYKNDKTGLYALGQLDADKPNALILSKRFAATDYSLHIPYACFVQGPNYYAAFSDNGTDTIVRCATNNSPSRSNKAVYESIFDDDGDAIKDKTLLDVALITRPLSASTSIALAVNKDYGSYTTYSRPDGSSHNATNAVMGKFPIGITAKTFQYKLSWTSSGTSSAKLTSIVIRMSKHINY